MKPNNIQGLKATINNKIITSNGTPNKINKKKTKGLVFFFFLFSSFIIFLRNKLKDKFNSEFQNNITMFQNITK